MASARTKVAASVVTAAVLILASCAHAESTPRRGLHNHDPQHGGVVTMAGMLHLEALALRDGHVRVYVTDVWRQPVPLEKMRGAITLDLPDGPRTFPVAIHDGALEATTPQLLGSAVRAHVHVTSDGGDLEEHFLLPVRGTS